MRRDNWSPCDYYEAYRAARDEAEATLAGWRAAPIAGRRDAFAAYRAAADREDAAAAAWLTACARYDRDRRLAA